MSKSGCSNQRVLCHQGKRWQVVSCLLLLFFQLVFSQDDMTRPDSRWLITSSQACLSTIECSPGFYCTGPTVTPNYRCLPRVSENAPCPRVGIGACVTGLFCAEEKSPERCTQFLPGGDSCARCQRRIPDGMSCPTGDIEPCLGIASCDRSLQKCRVPGLLGDSCTFESDCQKNLGLICKANRCMQKLPFGAQCFFSSSCAVGFCSGGFETISGKCVPYRIEGQVCSELDQCERPNVTTPFDDRLLCNTNTATLGMCVRDSRLIKRLGAPCKPNEDRCDRRRSLSCLWAQSLQQFVCQQRGTGDFETFCTPGSPFSKCEVTPTHIAQCRRDRTVDGKVTDFYKCRLPLVTVRRGSICNLRKNTICELGTSCEVVPGVTNDARFGGPPELARVCVQVKKEGQGCRDKFRSICGKGLECVDGKCRIGQSAGSTNITHASYYNSCSDLPCMPGTVCELTTPQSSFPVCLPPRKMVKAGDSCSTLQFVRKECPPDLLCLPGRQDEGSLRCRKSQGVGDRCFSDEECPGNLRCGPESYTGPSSPRYCYNITTALEIGATCDPNDSSIERRCVGTLFTRDGNIVFGRPLECLPKGGGFACQQPVALFGYCSAEGNLACRDKIAECRNGVCQPRPPKT